MKVLYGCHAADMENHIQLPVKSNQVYPDLTAEILNNESSCNSTDESVVSVRKPVPAPRKILPKAGDLPLPKPRPRSLKKKGKSVDNPLYYTVHLEDDESGDKKCTFSIPKEDAAELEENVCVAIRNRTPPPIPPELVLEFDPFPPEHKSTLWRSGLTNSIFVIDQIKALENDSEGTYSATASLSSFPMNSEADTLSLCSSTNSSVDIYDIPVRKANSQDSEIGIEVSTSWYQPENWSDVGQTAVSGTNDDTASVSSVELQAPMFPPPPLPEGFSDFDGVTLRNYSPQTITDNVDGIAPPIFPAPLPPILPDKPALPPKNKQGVTPSAIHSQENNYVSRGSDISLQNKVPPVPSRINDSRPKTPPKIIKPTRPAPPLPSHVSPKENAPPLPPRRKAKTNSWDSVNLCLDDSIAIASRHNSQAMDADLVLSKQAILQKKLCFRGHLYKTGSNRKDFLKRWCVLECGSLKYFMDEKSEVAQDEILIKDILSVAKVIDVKTNMPELFCFEVNTTKNKGRSYLFGSTYPSEREGWMEHLVFAISPPSAADDNKDFSKAGYLNMRIGMTGHWKSVWALLRGKQLIITYKDTDVVETYDLRKIKAINVHSSESKGYHNVIEEGSPFVADFPDKPLYFQGALISETEDWYARLRHAMLDIGPRLEEQQLTQNNIPVIVEKCIAFISLYGCCSVGIYRSNGVNSKVNRLLDSFRHDAWTVNIKVDEFSEQDVASAIKQFFRTLPDSLMTKRLYSQWISAAALQNKEDQIAAFQKLLEDLPEVNYCTLKYLISHLRSLSSNSDKTLMTVSNLALVFAPTLLASDQPDLDTSNSSFRGTPAEIVVLTFIINNYPELFKVSINELEKEHAIQKALMDMRESKQPKKPAGDILIGVHVFSKDSGKCLNIKVSPTMSAYDICSYAIEHAKVRELLESIAVFEVVCNGDLERPLHFSETVLPVILRWARWPDAKDNYLVIKKNEIYQAALPLARQPLSMFSELKFGDKKSKNYKKLLLEFKNARLSIYKDARIVHPEGTWNIEDITWYIGCESKRSCPSKWSFTFIERNADMKRSKEKAYFGYTVCCTTEDEFHKWIAAMLIAEFPGGLIPRREIVDLLT